MAIIKITQPVDSQAREFAMESALPSVAKAITPSDTDTYDPPIAVYVGTGGDVVAIPAQASDAVTVKCQDGGMVPFLCKAVLSSGTTAANLIALA